MTASAWLGGHGEVWLSLSAAEHCPLLPLPLWTSGCSLWKGNDEIILETLGDEFRFCSFMQDQRVVVFTSSVAGWPQPAAAGS